MSKKRFVAAVAIFVLFVILFSFSSSAETISQPAHFENEVKTISNVGLEDVEFELSVQNITAGESPRLKILNATDQEGDELSGEYEIKILMMDEEKSTVVTFVDGNAEQGLDKITNAASYEIEVTIGDISKVEEFFVETGKVETVEIDPVGNKTILVEEKLVFSSEAKDEYGNIITENASDFDWENATEGLFHEETRGAYEVRASYSDVTSNSTRINVKAHFFRVDIISYDEGIEQDETFSVEYVVENWGESTSTQDIEFEVNGELIEIKEDLTLEPGERYEGEFRYTVEDLGEYEMRISSQDSEVVRIFSVHAEEIWSMIFKTLLYVPIGFLFLPMVIVFGFSSYLLVFALIHREVKI